MKARDVAEWMHEIEDAVSDETRTGAPALDKVVAVLLDIDNDDDQLAKVLSEESARCLDLLAEHYSQLGILATMGNAAALGIVQGITFAVAAQRLRDTEPGT